MITQRPSPAAKTRRASLPRIAAGAPGASSLARFPARSLPPEEPQLGSPECGTPRRDEGAQVAAHRQSGATATAGRAVAGETSRGGGESLAIPARPKQPRHGRRAEEGRRIAAAPLVRPRTTTADRGGGGRISTEERGGGGAARRSPRERADGSRAPRSGPKAGRRSSRRTHLGAGGGRNGERAPWRQECVAARRDGQVS